ncbi:mammalian ependymin-related protein 1 [Crocuta crocuta]
MFQIEQATKQCSKITLTEPWDPLDIPQNATFEDQYYIGGPLEQITVQEWSDRKSARSYETWIGIYTAKDCYPVQETFTKNYSVILSTRFFDIQLGIEDPSVFTPPSTCQAARAEWLGGDCSWEARERRGAGLGRHPHLERDVRLSRSKNLPWRYMSSL